ncbi:MAG TPA: uroporphyrinogen-III C-methyltransferase [Candidatus Acidoferrum sp.]|nr:uroporphyrinogen-III C-methyltransferase [Candidatus Acidoferrum sp.]
MGLQFSLPGKVYLTGAGPGSASLLTLRALEALRFADVVFHDDLVSEDVLSVIPPHVAVHSVGKRCGLKRVSQEQIHNRMIAEARKGRIVVRLKGGDPLIFGRIQEEISALREAGVAFEIIPGITAATAAAAAAQIPLTERVGASKLVFLSNHCCAEKTNTQLEENLAQDSTLVFYMPGSNLGDLSERLLRNGLSKELPCLLVSNVARGAQRLIRADLRSLSSLAAQASPSLLIVGATVTTAEADEFLLQEDAAQGEARWHTEDLALDEPAPEDLFESKLPL